MHAQDAYYHASCLTVLCNRIRNIRPLKVEADQDTSQISLEAIALAELVMYIEEAPIEGSSARTNARAQHVYGRKRSKVNVSSDIGAALNFSKTHDHDAEAMYLAKAETLVTKELFSKKQCFNGAFDAHSQRSEVP